MPDAGLPVELALQTRIMSTKLMPRPSAAAPRSRTDTRTALVVELALAILQSSGRAQAAEYLHASGVALHVALRVLHPRGKLRRPEH